MSSRFPPILSFVVALSLLTACAEAPSKQTMGTGIGAVGGGLLGSMFGSGIGRAAATAAGGLLGAWLGSAAGKSLDKADKEKAAEAAEAAHTASVGDKVSWSNPDTGNSGNVAVTGESVDAAGRQCRDYTSTIRVDGKDEVVNGTACRQPDGSWAAK
ncbi:RT0821/Lpp0805 family surface protein [Magnetospirillum sp. SS-4]|uniref:RT0821/Lpp0805 family surface protein n=1 Tax=Magnetospirillum sp. SS-4 TaxID=2681465 RepID=UPI001382CE09|nr:RT0821/Lpp0805 family surface protein [Magnetospirillum sp. SS-4]CAA7618035.1 17 kDa surface antigen [Magnetospirillum sp. SS-4]